MTIENRLVCAASLAYKKSPAKPGGAINTSYVKNHSFLFSSSPEQNIGQSSRLAQAARLPG